MNNLITKDRYGLLLVLVYLSLIFSLSLIESGNSDSDPEIKVNTLMAWQVVIATLLFIVPVTLFCRFLRPERSSFLNMNSMPHIYFLITAAACIFFALPAVAGLEQWNKSLHLPEFFSSIEKWMIKKDASSQKFYDAMLEDKSATGLLINLLVGGLVAALSEELFFRGLLQQMFIKNRINAHLAIWITAILFSAIHFQFYGFFSRVFLGAILGYLYYITQNLWVSIGAHFFNNAFLIVYVHSLSDELVSVNEKPAGPEQNIGIAFVLLSMAMVAGQLFFLQRFVNRMKLPPTNTN